MRAGGEAADDAEVLAMFRAEMLQESGKRNDLGNNITKVNRSTGTSRAYSIDRVQRGCDPETVDASIKDDAEVLAMFRAEMLGEEGGDGSNQHTRATCNNVTGSKAITGNSRAYSIDVVQRKCDPETVAEVMAGTISPNAALERAGRHLGDRVYRLRVDTVGLGICYASRQSSLNLPTTVMTDRTRWARIRPTWPRSSMASRRRRSWTTWPRIWQSPLRCSTTSWRM